MTDWFSIRSAELPWISELVQAWKKDQKTPMNIFIFYEAPSESQPQERVLLEHWQCVYAQKSNTILQGSDVKALYNKFVIMFRSLYIYLKVWKKEKKRVFSFFLNLHTTRCFLRIGCFGPCLQPALASSAIS